MLRRYLSIASIVFLVFSMTLGVLVLNSDIASAETWTDDFSDDDFDARWIKGGIGRTDIVDEYAWALSFDQYPENPGFPIADEDLPLWYGPTLRANISTASDFDITVVFDCVADITDYNVGRLEVKLLDSSGKSVYTFGWADTSNDTNEVSLNLRGWNGASIFTTGENYDYTVFADKPMTLQRTGDQLVFLVDGAEKFSGQTDIKGINAVELVFLKLKEVDILMCTPTTMQFGSISIQTTDASVPSKPLDIECLGDDSFINLNWTEPADDGGLPVTGYKIYRGETSGSLEFLTSVGQVYGFNDTGLTNGITYYYQVSAVNDAGDSSLSDEASGIPITFPGAPRNLQGLTDSNGVQLSWEAPNSDGGADITQYKVFRGIQSDSLTELAVLGNVLEYQDISITNGSTYYYYSVSAVNSQGESPMTSPIEVITGAAATAPSAPRELSAIPGDSQVILEWVSPESSGNSPITNYMIYRGTSASSLSMLTTIGNFLNYTDSSVDNAQEYHYQVSAVNAIGESSASDIVSATPKAPSVPSAPQNFVLIPGNNSVQLQWTAPEDDGSMPITGYKVYRGNTLDDMVELATLGNVFSYTDTDILQGQEYYYAVSALNSVGEIPLSEAASENITIGDKIDTGTDTSGGWSLNSSIVTVIATGIGVLAMFLIIRRPDSDNKSSSEGPDNTVDNETNGDRTDKEGSKD